MARLSKDPWGNDYRYRFPGTRGPGFDVYSLGPDGLEGSPETDQDNVGNWAPDN
jgi:general secretion pathway protein G